MKRFRPLHGIALVLVFVAAGVMADHALEGGFGHTGYELVRPAKDGSVVIDIADLGQSQVRYFRFLNYGNQEVKFFIGRDRHGTVHVAFDASASHSKLGRGFRHEGDWMVDNKCDSAVRLEQVNEGGRGCTPVPLPHRLDGERVLLAESDILRGWRYFR